MYKTPPCRLALRRCRTTVSRGEAGGEVGVRGAPGDIGEAGMVSDNCRRVSKMEPFEWVEKRGGA